MALLNRSISLRALNSLSRTLCIINNNNKNNKQSRLFSTEANLDDELTLQRLDGNLNGVIVMTINRPAAKNSLSKNLMRLFDEHITTLSEDTTARAVVLRSVVPRVFCAGADLKERKQMKEEDVPVFVSSARALLHRLSQIPVPTICALEGAALGGGLEIALTCDFRVASTTAKLGLPETKLAIIPGAGGTVRLPRLIGISKAKELIYTGRVLGSVDAHAIGLVDYSVEQNEDGDAAYKRGLELAQEIVGQGPIALKMAKQSINLGVEVGIDEALDIEGKCYANVVPTKDRVEALKAFAEKRKPVFYGE